MMFSPSLLLAALSGVAVWAAPAPVSSLEDAPIDIAVRQWGGNYIFSDWHEGNIQYSCVNGQGGSYTVNWSGTGGFVCGKGWSPGGSRTVNYQGTYKPNGPGYLALYGWTRNPLIEYYVVDAHGELAPNEPWTEKGNFTSDGGTYTVYQSTRVNQPSIVGTATFQQFWSVRTEQRVGGTITTGNHYSAWSRFGMQLGQHDYMILATEGYTNSATGQGSSGSSTINLY